MSHLHVDCQAQYNPVEGQVSNMTLLFSCACYNVRMKWNPFLNAILATAYIGGVVTFLQFIESVRHNTEDSVIDAMGLLSLFVFSAAVMAFLFFYQPLLILMEGKRKEAMSFFIKTLATFGAITVLILALVSVQ
jgi:hypothetical protein